MTSVHWLPSVFVFMICATRSMRRAEPAAKWTHTNAETLKKTAVRRAQHLHHGQKLWPNTQLPKSLSPACAAPSCQSDQATRRPGTKRRQFFINRPAAEVEPASCHPQRPNAKERSPRGGKVPRQASELHSTWRPSGRTLRSTTESAIQPALRGDIARQRPPARGRPLRNAPAKLARHGRTAQNQKCRAPEAGPASRRPQRPSPRERSPWDGKVPWQAGEPH